MKNFVLPLLLAAPVLLAALVLLPSAVRAQSSPDSLTAADSTGAPVARGIASASFTLGFPQREFGSHVDNVGYGLHLFIGAAFTEVPVAVGLEGSFLTYGHESREEPFSTTVPEVFVDVTTTNNLAAGHAVVRLQPPVGRVRPYLDGLIGVKYLYTRTKIESDNAPDDEPVASSINFDDFAFSYGVGAGLDVVVYRDPESGSELAVNLGARYLFGGEAEYLKEGSIERNGRGGVVYNIERSRTDLLTLQLGLSLMF